MLYSLPWPIAHFYTQTCTHTCTHRKSIHHSLIYHALSAPRSVHIWHPLMGLHFLLNCSTHSHSHTFALASGMIKMHINACVCWCVGVCLWVYMYVWMWLLIWNHQAPIYACCTYVEERLHREACVTLLLSTPSYYHLHAFFLPLPFFRQQRRSRTHVACLLRMGYDFRLPTRANDNWDENAMGKLVSPRPNPKHTEACFRNQRWVRFPSGGCRKKNTTHPDTHQRMLSGASYGIVRWNCVGAHAAVAAHTHSFSRELHEREQNFFFASVSCQMRSWKWVPINQIRWWNNKNKWVKLTPWR